jgi:hypothetical protein
LRSTAETPTLKEIVQGFDTIIVDDYQRTYEWEKESISELFNDLKAAVELDKSHFFGTLIFQVSKDGTQGSLVDGQQRLTTVFCLVAALRDQIKKLEVSVIPAKVSGRRSIKLLDMTLDFLHPGDDLETFRFQSSRILRPTLNTMVFADPDSGRRAKLKERDLPATLKLRKGVQHIRDLILEDLVPFGPEEKAERILELMDTLLNKFRVLFISSSDLNESLDIFLTLNNRGTPLGRSDIVRGLIMKNLGLNESQSKQTEIHHSILNDWQEINNQVVDAETFMRHYLVSTTRNKVTKKLIVEEVQKRIDSSSPEAAKSTSRDFWDKLGDSASVYGKIRSASIHPKIQERLQLLNVLLKSHRIFLMAVFQSDLVEKDQIRFFELAENLAYRWVASGGNAQILENEFQEWSMDLREGADAQSIENKIVVRLRNLGFDVLNFLRNEGDSSYVVRALLYTLEYKLSPGANPIPAKNIHLEHIAPDSSTESWIHALSPDRPDEDTYQILNSNAGNLTLLDYKLNTAIKQSEFSIKRDTYKNATFLITRDIGVSMKEWTGQEIELRCKWLAECFDAVWPAGEGSGSVSSFSKWSQDQAEL